MDDPYIILGVNRTSTMDEIRKAYHNLLFRYHPDQKTGNHEQFIKVQIAYEAMEKNRNILELLREFKSRYIGHETEKNDLIVLYNKFEGNMKKIIDDMFCAEDEDEERLRAILDPLIANNTLKKFDLYEERVSNDKRRANKKKKERKEIEIDELALLEQLQKNDEKRKKRWEDLTKKYLPALKKKSKDTEKDNSTQDNENNNESKPKKTKNSEKNNLKKADKIDCEPKSKKIKISNNNSKKNKITDIKTLEKIKKESSDIESDDNIKITHKKINKSHKKKSDDLAEDIHKENENLNKSNTNKDTEKSEPVKKLEKILVVNKNVNKDKNNNQARTKNRKNIKKAYNKILEDKKEQTK